MKNETCTIFACKSKSRGLVIFNFLHAALIGRFGIGMLQEQVGFFSWSGNVGGLSVARSGIRRDASASDGSSECDDAEAQQDGKGRRGMLDFVFVSMLL